MRGSVCDELFKNLMFFSDPHTTIPPLKKLFCSYIFPLVQTYRNTRSTTLLCFIKQVCARANSVEYGLSASVWSQDVGKIHRVAHKLQVHLLNKL